MRFRCYFIILVMNLVCAVISAETLASSALIRGTVQDTSGALIPDAHVAITTQHGEPAAEGDTDSSGSFHFADLPPGSYSITVTKDGFREVKESLKVASSPHSPLRIVMPVAAVAENITVEASDASAKLSTDIAQNQSGNVVDANALDRLPVFDADYITTMSRFLDPDSSGTNGMTLVVNGVEANGPGVTASAIQSVKINQNPYTALYSRPGRARIEIITKGGTPQFHGSANFLYRNSVFDATNAFAETKPPENRTYLEGSMTGPLSRSKTTTFLLALDTDYDHQQAIVNAAGPDGPINTTCLIRRTTTSFRAVSFTITLEEISSGSDTRMNIVASGIVGTPIHTNNPKDFLKTLSPMGTISRVSDVAEPVVHLAKARNFAGEALHVDGGAHQDRS
jgi:Carboxypeptidase regulatory-like domain